MNILTIRITEKRKKVRFEIKKLFSALFVWISLIITALFAVFFTVSCISVREQYGMYEKLLEDINKSSSDLQEQKDFILSKKSPLEEYVPDKVDELRSIAGEYGNTGWDDYILYDKALSQLKYLKNFPNNRKKLISNALDCIVLENEKTEPNQSYINQNLFAAKKYNRIIDLTFSDTGNVGKFMEFFDNTLWDYVMTALAVMLTVRMFTLDRGCKANKVVFSSSKCKSLFFKQLAACSAPLLGTVVFHTLLQMLCGTLFFGVKNYALPLQAESIFEYCPFNLTIGGFIALKSLGKILFYFLIISFSALMSVVMKKQLPAIFTSLSAGIASIIISMNMYIFASNENLGVASEERIMFNNLRSFMPSCLLNPKEYFLSFDYISIGGLYLSRLTGVMTVTAVISVLCVLLAFRNYARAEK